MYVAAVFVTFAMTAFAIAGMDVALHFVRARVLESANRYAQVALQGAEASLRAQIAEQVAAGSPDGPFAAPSASPATAVCGPNVRACPLFAATSVVLGGQTFAAGANANERAINVQRASGVFENRLGATLTVTIASADGTAIATRSQNVTMRTFAAPPYAAIDGVAQPMKNDAPEGDSAGCDPAAQVCHRGDLVPASDTLIHATATCDSANYGAQCDGLPDRPVDAYASPAWQNENARLPTWSR